MEFTGAGLDEVLIDLYHNLLSSNGRNVGTRGSNKEILGALLRIEKPRSRLSRSENRGKPFSALGELLWYLVWGPFFATIRRPQPGHRQLQESPDGISETCTSRPAADSATKLPPVMVQANRSSSVIRVIG
jgi:thymidylate synthase